MTNQARQLRLFMVREDQLKKDTYIQSVYNALSAFADTLPPSAQGAFIDAAQACPGHNSLQLQNAVRELAENGRVALHPSKPLAVKVLS